MVKELPTLPVRGRAAAQDRSLETKRKIVRAAINIIAERGLAGLTHRLVAQQAGVSLAATTYYYETKFDIVAEVSNTLLNTYAESFERAARRIRAGVRPPSNFQDFVNRLLQNTARRNHAETIAWMEFLLDAARHPENMELVRQWAVRLQELWVDIAVLHHEENPDIVARSAIDLIIGVQLAILALGLDEADITAVLIDGKDPFDRWARPKEPTAIMADAHSLRGTPKSRATRERILDATMRILIEEGAGAVSYRLVAKQAGLTPAAPAYHFSTLSALLREAQTQIFDSCKARYRVAMSGIDYKALDIERLVDLTATVFLREATEFGAQNLASYGIWLEAARQPELRPWIWDAIEDQGRAWNRTLGNIQREVRPGDGLLVQCMFIGKLIRITCLGASTPDLAQVRQEFYQDLSAIVGHQHWASNKNSTND